MELFLLFVQNELNGPIEGFGIFAQQCLGDSGVRVLMTLGNFFGVDSDQADEDGPEDVLESVVVPIIQLLHYVCDGGYIEIALLNLLTLLG